MVYCPLPWNWSQSHHQTSSSPSSRIQFLLSISDAVSCDTNPLSSPEEPDCCVLSALQDSTWSELGKNTEINPKSYRKRCWTFRKCCWTFTGCSCCLQVLLLSFPVLLRKTLGCHYKHTDPGLLVTLILTFPQRFFFFLFQKLHFSKTLLACDILEQPLCPISKTEHLSPLKKQPVTFPAGKASQKMMIMLIKWVSASPVAVLEAFSTLITMLYFWRVSPMPQRAPHPSLPAAPSQASQVETLPAYCWKCSSTTA